MEKLLSSLNDKQIEAVTTTEGPLLVLAGAGSGKTTVLVNRIAYIIAKHRVSPYNILAITFTNKAAKEMKDRITNLLGNVSDGMWIGTFHSVCVRILRTTIDLLGYTRDFVIYDGADTKTLLKDCLKELDLDEKNFPIRNVSSVISSAKNDMMEPDTFEREYKNDYRMNIISRIYKLYQAKLRANNALDFDDIILFTVKILSQNPDVLMKYQSRFEYVIVDEYQDTNNTQYNLIKLLSDGYRNICVVGDDDQSIYKFRGANINNILNFQDDFQNAKVIRLEQNYRSTQTILNAANTVIDNNRERMGKNLWTDNGEGKKITAYTGTNEYDEGKFIANKIKEHCNAGGKYSDCAVLYRTNAQSRVIEEMLMRSSVPYRVLAGLRFYDRKEIKDIIAYLRLIHNPHDDLSLKRIINEPKRKIGNATVEKAQRLANENNCGVFDIICMADTFPELKSAAQRLKDFATLMVGLITKKDNMKLSEFVKKVMDQTGYLGSLTAEQSIENQTRIDNLEEFMSVVSEFESSPDYNGTLSELLENISLVSDLDALDEDIDSAVLMTIHSAKGLEFPVVFLAGFEEGLFPGLRSMGDDEDLEEERRLCYVAITRAKEELYLTKTHSRTIFGRTSPARASRFFDEIPKEYLDEQEDKPSIFERAQNKIGISYIPPTRTQSKHSYDDEKTEIDFKAGDRVLHRKFGEGTIISAQAFGSDAILQINFDSIGQKQLMAAFAKLKKIKKG